VTPAPTAQAPASGGAAAPRVSHGLAAFALALLLGLQPVTTDVYLPALPMLARDLGAPMSAAQLTMSALILAFGLAQLFWGPVADRLGRRPVLITGLLLYTAASIGSVLAGSIGWLVVWRVLQGATMAAAVVCARAIVRDLYEPLEGARVMSLALSGLGVIAIAGPVLGGVVAAFGALTLAFVAWRLPETLLHKNPDATRAGPLLAQWGQIARHPTFIAWTLLVSATYGGLFTILAGSSFTYIDVLGLSPGWYGLAMASGSLSYLGGTFVCRRWIVRHGIRGAVARGGGFTLAGGVLIVALALAGVHSVWAIVVPQWLFAFGHGIHQPCGQAGAVGPFPRAAGAASALAGFVLAITAFGIGLWLGQALDGTVLPYALGIGFWSVATATVAWTLVQRHTP
jgi:DHA1 family bicyclomycin/chloramphenicol resistance-like MFS transporter